MAQILRYFIAAPLVSVELLVASFFINLLALAVSIFVMLVLQRYVSFGVDSTLFTLTSGVVIAVVFEFLLRNARLALAMHLSQKTVANLGNGAFGLLATSHCASFSALPQQQKSGLFRNLDKVASAHAGQNICTLLDVPFAALFIGVIYLFNASLALVVFAFVGAVTLVSWVSQLWVQKRVRDYEKMSAIANEKVSRIALAGEASRVFDPGLKLVSDWKSFLPEVSHARNRLALLQGRVQNRAGLLQALLSITVIAYGAILVVGGELPVSVLIGVNILAARALNPFVRMGQVSIALAAGKESRKQLAALARLPAENNRTNPSPDYRGTIEFQDLAFSLPR